MQKFEVRIMEVWSYVVEVEAESEDEARTHAKELVWHGNYPNGEPLAEAEYSHTLDSEEWKVWEA